jgi:hypothetical protein
MSRAQHELRSPLRVEGRATVYNCIDFGRQVFRLKKVPRGVMA